MSLAEIPRVDPFEAGSDIILTNTTFTWPRDDSAVPMNNGTMLRSTATTPKNAFTLADLTLRFPAGKLSLICGKLGTLQFLLIDWRAEQFFRFWKVSSPGRSAW